MRQAIAWRPRRTLLLLTAVAAVAAATSVAPSHRLVPAAEAQVCTAAPSGMGGWWSGDTDGSDISGNANNGTLVGNTAVATGFVGNAFSFDGSGDYVDIPDSASLKPPDFTIDGWFKFNGTSGLQHLIAKPFGAGSSDAYGLYLNGGTLWGVINGAGGELDLDSGFPLTPGPWYHVAMTYSDAANAVVFYVNGSQVASFATSESLIYDTQNVLIGADHDTGVYKYFLNGLADEVEVIDHALTPGEVFSLFGAGSSGKCKGGPAGNACTTVPTGMVGWWSGQSNADDGSGQGNDGALTNGVAFGNHVVGLSFNFDGVNDYVFVPDSPSLRVDTTGTGGYTLDGWFRFDSIGSLVALVGKVVNQPSVFDSYQMYLSGGRLYGLVGNSGGIDEHDSGVSIGTGAWYHLAVTFDDPTNAIKFYVNGSLVSSQTTTFSPGYDSNGVIIGADRENGNFAFFMDGQADEVEVIDHALADSEIAAIFAAGSGGKCGAPTTAAAVTAFAASRSTTGTVVSWRTARETDVAGFNVYRGAVKVNARLVRAKRSGQAIGASYRFVDRLSRRQGIYRLQIVHRDGGTTWAATTRAHQKQ